MFLVDRYSPVACNNGMAPATFIPAPRKDRGIGVEACKAGTCLCDTACPGSSESRG